MDNIFLKVHICVETYNNILPATRVNKPCVLVLDPEISGHTAFKPLLQAHTMHLGANYNPTSMRREKTIYTSLLDLISKNEAKQYTDKMEEKHHTAELWALTIFEATVASLSKANSSRFGSKAKFK